MVRALFLALQAGVLPCLLRRSGRRQPSGGGEEFQTKRRVDFGLLGDPFGGMWAGHPSHGSPARWLRFGSGGWKSEIIKGTGRFEGIKGTQSAKAKYLPLEKGEGGSKGYGEGTITYTLPPK
jgi:hypothetical protein